MFNVLRPIYIPIGGDLFAMKWEILGQVQSMEEAKQRFGGAPILEKVKE